MKEAPAKKVIFATPSLAGATAPYWESIKNCLPLIEKHGWEHQHVQELGNPYISAARSIMTRKALDTKPDVIVYIDYDVSFEPEDMLKLLEAEGDVVCGTYRYKTDEEEYMGDVEGNIDGIPITRSTDNAILAIRQPAGFLKVTRKGIQRFMKGYPELCYGDPDNLSVDLFNHGAFQGTWYGEDYAFCRNWRAIGGQIWLLADLNLTHNHKQADGTYKAYPGNYQKFLEKELGNQSTASEPEPCVIATDFNKAQGRLPTGGSPVLSILHERETDPSGEQGLGVFEGPGVGNRPASQKNGRVH